MKFVTIFDPKKEINFVKRFKIATSLSLLLPVLSVIALFVFGIPWGIDFLGGLEMQVKFPNAVSAGDVREALEDVGFNKNQVQQYGSTQNNELLIRVERVAALQDADVERIKQLVQQKFGESKILFDAKSGSQLSIWLDEAAKDETDPNLRKLALTEQRRQLADLLHEKSGVELRKSAATKDASPDIYGALTPDEPQNGQVRYTVHFAGVSGKIQKLLEAKFGAVEIRKVDFVDSQVSQQLRTDGLLAVIYSLIAIVIYVALRFDLFFSPGAIVALIADVMGALLVFTIGRVEFDTPSIAALLTILGYSINNTIIIYDRIREDVPKGKLSAEELKPYINKAINQTFSRTINSTLTTLIASSSLWIFATGTIQNFAMVLTIGIIIGVFTSLFISPAAYLLAKKYFKQSEGDDNFNNSSKGHTREERAKGVV